MSKILNSSYNFLFQVFTCKISYILLVIHWSLATLAIYQRGGIEEEFHLYYESILFIIIAIIDIPGLVLGFILTFVIITPLPFIFSLTKYHTNMLIASCFFLGICLQWLLIGYGIKRFTKS